MAKKLNYTTDRWLAEMAQEQVTYIHLERGLVDNMIRAYATVSRSTPGTVPGHEEEVGTLTALMLASVGTGVKLIPEGDRPPNIRVAVPRLLVDAIKDSNERAKALGLYVDKNPDGGPLGERSMDALAAHFALQRQALGACLTNVIITELASYADGLHDGRNPE